MIERIIERTIMKNKIEKINEKLKEVKQSSKKRFTWSMLSMILLWLTVVVLTSSVLLSLYNINKSICELKESQTYVLLELRENEQSVKSVKSTVVQNTKQIDSLIDKYALKYGVNPKLAHAVAIVESNKNQNSKNGSAIGVMQIKPSTAKGMGVNNVYETESNIEAGVKYLAYLKKKFNNNEQLVISAYNTGENGGQKQGKIPNKKYVQKVQAVKSKL